MPHLKNLQVEHKKEVIADLEQTEREEINDFIISTNFYLTRAFLVGVCLIFTIFVAAIYCIINSASANVSESFIINATSGNVSESFLANEDLLNDIQKTTTDNNNCGVIWYYHIGKCGGTTMGTWFEMHHKSGDIASYDNFYFRKLEDLQWDKRVLKIEKEIKDIKNLGWIAKKSHHRSPGMVWLEKNITRWRNTVENQGCKFILMTIIRNPMERLLSKIFFGKQTLSTIETAVSENVSSMNSYLLYNWFNISETFKEAEKLGIVHHPYYTLPDDSVEKAIQMFENFDIIADTGHYDLFLEKLESITGWPKKKDVYSLKTPKSQKFSIPPEIIVKMSRVIKDDEIVYNYLMRKKILLIEPDEELILARSRKKKSSSRRFQQKKFKKNNK